MRSIDEAAKILLNLSDRIATRLRAGERVGRTVTVRFRFADLATRATRSRTLLVPTAATHRIHQTAVDLAEPIVATEPVTLLGISVSHLCRPDAIQQALPFTGADNEAVDEAVDEVRQRFGREAVKAASLLSRPSDGPWDLPQRRL